MNTLLLVVTALSLTMATILAVVVARMARSAQRHADARARLLAELAAEPPARIAIRPAAEPIVVRPAPVPLRSGPVAVPVAALSEPAPIDDDFLLQPEAAPVATNADLFAARETPSAIGPRLAAAGAFALVVFVVGFALLSRHARAPQPPVSAQAAAPAPATPASSPLELMSLRHAPQESGLTITGVVQNPRGNTPVSHVIATVVLFGTDGSFLASGRAPLDFTTLAPGEESPFVVPVSVAGSVSRYRIGFRAEDGAVISHVDKRGPEALARN